MLAAFAIEQLFHHHEFGKRDVTFRFCRSETGTVPGIPVGNGQ